MTRTDAPPPAPDDLPDPPDRDTLDEPGQDAPDRASETPSLPDDADADDR